MGIDKYCEDNKVLITKGEQRKKYGDQDGRKFGPRDMSTFKCHYC